jgi:secreted Zn-dependent insulinase-like peptidase
VWWHLWLLIFCSQVGQSSIGSMALSDVLGNILYQTAFNQLRTIEQLGYIVFGKNIELHGVTALLILVQSERVKSYTTL